MNKALLYYGSMAVCGGILGVLGLRGLTSGTISITTVFWSVGGVGMVLGSIYEGLFAQDSTESLPDDRLIWIFAGCAVLAVVGFFWSLIP